ncbi:NYN domain [Phocoenobacter uteri]|uniref:NYN domain n=1 Tax=Phocoenobacter uteri TaxID=146806 RepID=A0A379C7G3_9PAST|nr:NYN domain-containing protein [Phocoenobacter uteri]MDG6882101.1 hypothetical protein [Phocoenobacter uteri]SUB58250.1 NYN domain [Phocoenobacter uteri]
MAQQVALLIDAENISYKSIPLIFNKLSTLGTVGIKRVYGDFSSDTLKSWSDTNNEYSLNAIHQPNYVSGKNTADIRITMDTMSLFFENPNINAFALASSDSDFTPLVQYLTEKGYAVYGFGDGNKTKNCFANACSQFFDVSQQITNDENIDITSSSKKVPFTDIFKAIEICKSRKNNLGDGFAYLGEVSSELKNINPNFKYKDFGCSTLGKFFEKYPEFETHTIKSSKYIRKFDYPALLTSLEYLLIAFPNKKGTDIKTLAIKMKETFGSEPFLQYCTEEDLIKRLQSITNKNFIIENNTIKLSTSN